MSKTETTQYLERKIREATSKLGVFKCFEVTIGLGGKERVDYMTVDTKGIWRCYEIKCSLADFRSKAAKSFYGHYNYYVLTQELYEKVKDEIPKHIGIYVGGMVKRNAKRQELIIDEDILKVSMIRSLAREADKYYFAETPHVIETYERQIRNFKQERDAARSREREVVNELHKRLGYRWLEKLDELLERA